VLSVPTEDAARIAVSTQNILREEAHLVDVIDPLGGAYYVEKLTDDMEEEIRAVMDRIEDAGGMYQAVESGIVQSMIGASALAFQEKVESGEQTVVGVNAYRAQEHPGARPALSRPKPEVMQAQLDRLARYKAQRSMPAVTATLDALARSAGNGQDNIFERVVDATIAGATHGEIVARLRAEMGFGEPLVQV